MNIILAADHAGFAQKEHIKGFLKQLGFGVSDEGAFSLDPDDDYPDYISIAAKRVASDPEHERAIVFGGSGQGEAIMCNREPGVRAAVYYGGPIEVVTLSRVHNNSNILSLGSRFLSAPQAEEAVKLWLNTAFPGEDRHIRRINKIEGRASPAENIF